MDHREIGWGGMDWIDLAEDNYRWRALVNTVMNLRVPYIVGKLLSTCTCKVVHSIRESNRIRNGNFIQ
jgi:hypothetical protein